jgi:ribonuclease G
MVAELDQELKKLVETFESITQKLKRATAPSLIVGEMDRASALLRDIYHPNFNRSLSTMLLFATKFLNIWSQLLRKKENCKLYKGGQPIFEHFGIEKQIKASFGKTVSFKNGAYLIIEHTEAFHVIDVNSGNRSKAGVDQETNALEVNLAAADEIARQLRLRDMGGIIVIDFIDMHVNENRLKVYERMKEAMAVDRTKHNILPLSKFCLMQITRQRVRPEEHVDTAEVCPTCKGSGKVTPSVLLVDELESKVNFIFKELNKNKLIIKVHPYVAAYLTKGFWSLKNKWSLKFMKRIVVEEVPSLSMLEYHFYDENQDEIIF